jgi:hypothetical protein
VLTQREDWIQARPKGVTMGNKVCLHEHVT